MSPKSTLPLIGAVLMAAGPAPDATATGTYEPDTEIIELRQYKIVPGGRDAFTALFEREFVETQEAEGMRLVGQFHDAVDSDRFIWIRTFPSMQAREAALKAFYYGPVWRAHRGTANPYLVDNDNVLLLHAAAPGLGFAATPERAAPGGAPQKAQPLRLTIHYLWKDATEGFGPFFAGGLKPAYERAGLEIVAGLVPERSANSFPALPVREGEKVFVWLARAKDDATFDRAQERLKADPDWPALKAILADYEERPAQVIRLQPTPRSALR